MVAPMESKEMESDGLDGFGGTNGDVGFGFAGLDGRKGLGDRSKQEKTALRDVEIFTLENLDMLFEETGLGC